MEFQVVLLAVYMQSQLHESSLTSHNCNSAISKKLETQWNMGIKTKWKLFSRNCQHQITPFHFTIPKWMSCTCRHSQALLFQGYFQLPPVKLNEEQKCTYDIYNNNLCPTVPAFEYLNSLCWHIRWSQGCFTWKESTVRCFTVFGITQGTRDQNGQL